MTSHPSVQPDDQPMPDLPDDLIRDIEAGQCVVFVGAGFSMPAMPAWRDLLLGIAEASEVDPVVRASVRSALASPRVTALDLEACAEVLREDLEKKGCFISHVREHLDAARIDQRLQTRRKYLQGTPFRAILTTNFDPVLEGEQPGRDSYISVLRPREHRWFEERFWDSRLKRRGPLVVKLHGDVAGETPEIVFTRRDYRTRLYEHPAFQTFLRSVFSTNTVLFLGYSFTDAYLNELRSEVLSLLGHRPGEAPIAYALMNDVTEAQRRYFRDHEGIHVLSYETSGGDFSAFDRWLERLYRACNPAQRFDRLLAKKAILWLDANPANNAYGWQFLQQACSNTTLTQVTTFDEAEAALARRRYDLVLTHWGHERAVWDGQPCSVAERLLRHVRAQEKSPPVIIFADERFADQNRRTAFSFGAQAFETRWNKLFQQIERVLR